MTEPAAAPPPAAAPRRPRLWWGLGAAAGLLLVLREAVAPVHGAFAVVEFFLFNGLYGALAAVAVIVIARLAERLLRQTEGAGDD